MSKESFKEFVKRLLSDEFINIFLKKDLFDEMLVRDKIIKNNEILVLNQPLFLGGRLNLTNFVIKDIEKENWLEWK